MTLIDIVNYSLRFKELLSRKISKWIFIPFSNWSNHIIKTFSNLAVILTIIVVKRLLKLGRYWDKLFSAFLSISIGTWKNLILRSIETDMSQHFTQIRYYSDLFFCFLSPFERWILNKVWQTHPNNCTDSCIPCSYQNNHY